MNFFKKEKNGRVVLDYNNKDSIILYLKDNNLYINNNWKESIWNIYNKRQSCKKCENLTNFRNYTYGYEKFCSCCKLKKKEVIDYNKIKSDAPNNVDLFKYFVNLGWSPSNKNHKKHLIDVLEEILKERKIFVNNISESLYRILNEFNDSCFCGNKFKFKSFKTGYRTYCSTKCSSNCTINTKNKEKTIKKKYGVKNIFCNGPKRSEFLEKTKEIYGSYCNRTKFKKTMYTQNKYVEIVEKTKNTLLRKYGVDNVSKISWVQNKKEETCLRNYGVRFPAQSAEIECCGSGTWGWKNYTLPSGKVIKIQGYENKLLTDLLKEHNENDIITSRKDMPEFWYTGEDNKQHRYFPDIYIPSINTIYEVKSSYTMLLEFDKNLRKAICVKDKDYNFEFKVYK